MIGSYVTANIPGGDTRQGIMIEDGILLDSSYQAWAIEDYIVILDEDIDDEEVRKFVEDMRVVLGL